MRKSTLSLFVFALFVFVSVVIAGEVQDAAHGVGCPYLHNKQSTVKDKDTTKPLTGCPLKEKCPYYHAAHNSANINEIDFSKIQGCPAAERCGYLQRLKQEGRDLKLAHADSSADPSKCPVIGKCPHFVKDSVVDIYKLAKNLDIDSVQNPEAVLEAAYEHAIAQCPVIQNLNKIKQTQALNQSTFTKRLFASVFPGDAAVNSLLATLYISLFPNLILAFVPADIDLESLNTLVAFAVGGLLGDVFLHLLPHSFLGEPTDNNIHYVLVDNKRNVVIGTALFVGFAIFFVIDKCMRVAGGSQDGHGHGHGHGHSHANENEEESSSATSSAVKGSQELRQRKKSSMAGTMTGGDDHEHDDKKADERQPSTSIKMSAYLNLIADASHNFTDGLAISASFYSSPAIGATTAVAVLLHEVPHEVGDYAILVQSGFSKTKAMASQFLTAGGAFAGTLAGIAIQTYGANVGDSTPTADVNGLFGTRVRFGDLVIPFTAGGFLYIATVAVVPELLNARSKGSKGKDAWQAVKEMVAMSIGIGLMLTIAWNE